jgi:hypothetical protein
MPVGQTPAPTGAAVATREVRAAVRSIAFARRSAENGARYENLLDERAGAADGGRRWQKAAERLAVCWAPALDSRVVELAARFPLFCSALRGQT